MCIGPPLSKNLNHRGSDCDLNALDRVQKFDTEDFIEEVEVDCMIERRTLFELVAPNLLLCLTLRRRDRTEVTVRIRKGAEPIVSDAVQGTLGMAPIRDFHTSHHHDVDAITDRLVLL